MPAERPSGGSGTISIHDDYSCSAGKGHTDGDQWSLRSGLAHQGGGVRRVAVGKTLLIAAVCAIIPLIGNVLASFLTTWTGAAPWLVTPAVGVIVAMVTALVQAYSSNPTDHRPPAHNGMYRAASRGISLPLALATAVLVIGVGGFAVTEGVRYVVGYVTGNESGTNRLVHQTSASAGGLTVTVEGVTYTAHFTRVDVAARNTTGTTLSLPLFGYCVLTGHQGTTLAADPFRSRWSDSLAPGSFQRGTIVFKGHLPASVRRASFSFTQIFGPGGGSITVRHLRLKPG
jgi:hypothetical protein